MITVLALILGSILVVGLVVLVLRSGNKGGRQGQSGASVATKQEQMSNPRGDVRSGTGPD